MSKLLRWYRAWKLRRALRAMGWETRGAIESVQQGATPCGDMPGCGQTAGCGICHPTNYNKKERDAFVAGYRAAINAREAFCRKSRLK